MEVNQKIRSYPVIENIHKEFDDPWCFLRICNAFLSTMPKKIPIITQTSSQQLKNGTVKSNVLPAHQMVVFQDVHRPSTTYIRNLELRNAPGLDLI